jgi:cellulose synthase operon protein B
MKNKNFDMGSNMKKQISKIFLAFIVCIPLLTILVNSVGAQTPTVVPTSLPTLTLPLTPTPNLTPFSALPSDALQLTNPDIVTFSQLHRDEIQLNGPYDSTSFSFAVPAYWLLKEGVQFDLLIGVSYNTGSQDQGDVIVIGGGTLTVLLNNIVLLTKPLDEVGETEIKVNIPLSSFKSTRSDGRISLEFVLDSGASCRVIGSHTSVYIHPTSYFNLPHDIVKPSTDLVNFPRPIFQNSFFPDSALLVIPDQPTAAELQAALTVAAGLGNLSSESLALDMVTLSGLKEDLAKQHLIFIGKASSLPWLDGLNLPLPSVSGQFQFSDGSLDDGLIEMIDSPWSSSHVVLVVSANTDAGVVKAAQALSSGVIRPNRFGNLALIEQVNTLPVSEPQAIDRTLSNLGYEFRSFQQRGEDSEDYIFDVPPGMTISTEAYFDMVYGHSSLLDYNASQIVVLLNDQPIGSVRMNDATAAVPTSHAKIMLPPSAVLQGTNRLSVRVTLEAIDDCTLPNSRGLWVNIWPESLIHLPLISTTFNSIVPQDLAIYPAPFVYNSSLEGTAFVLEHNNLESWRSAVQIAASLGYQAGGSLIKLSAFYGDAMPASERSKYHLLIIGRPSQIPIVVEMNNDLPAPFSSGNDMVSENGNFPVTYSIPPDSPMGYIETMLSPWNSENVVFAILGNTTQGVNWAATALVDPSLQWQLGGSFAVVNNKQIISSNTKYVETGSGEIPNTEVLNLVATPAGPTETELQTPRPGWILPVLIASIGLIVVIVITVMIQNQSRINTRKKREETLDNNNTS